MDEEVSTFRIPTEAFMEEATVHGVGMRRDEDIALDLMKFVAATTGYGRTASATVGFQGGGAATKPEEYAAHLLELYGKCLQALRSKK
jgi:xanthine dehydrogenase iron-sulfur cluster and FAD-binding subunit A